MTRFRQRRFLLCALTFVYTGFAASLLTRSARTALFITAAAITAASFLLPLIRALRSRLPEHALQLSRRVLCTALIALLFFGGYRHLAFDRHIEKWDGTSAEVTACIREKSYATAYSTAYIADVTTEGGDSFRILLVTPSDTFVRGDHVQCTVTFSAFAELSGSFPERRYYQSLGAVLQGETEKTALLYTKTNLLSHIDTWRESLIGMLRADLGRKESAVAAALFLGDRDNLADSLTRDFRRLGISHLLAVSGMHFTIILSALDKLLTTVLRKRKLRTTLLILASVAYMLLCGLTESVLRAGIMMLLSYTAVFLGRRSDTLTSLGISSLLICVIDPTAFSSVGFQLSVTAVLGLCAYERIRKKLKPTVPLSPKRKAIRETLGVFVLPIAIQIILSPMLCYYFGEISLFTPLASILFSPIITCILTLTPFYLLFRMILPIAAVLGTAITWLSSITGVLAEAFASLPGTTLSLKSPIAPLFAAALSAALLTAPLCQNKKSLRRHLRGTVCILLLFFVTTTASNIVTRNDVQIITSAKEKNDAVILHVQKDFLLIDISDGSYSALTAAYSAAAESGATEISALYLTHLHTKHVNAVKRFSDTVYVRAMILPSPETEEEAKTLSALTAFCEAEGLPYHLYGENDSVYWGDTVEIIPGEKRYLARSTHPIVTLTVHANGSVFSYIGASAAEIPTHTDLTGSDVIVFGSHGPNVKLNIYAKFSPYLRAAVMRDSAGTLSEKTKNSIPEEMLLFEDAETHIFTFAP